MSVGDVLEGHHNEKYAQPRIDYSLFVVVRARVGDSPVRMRQTHREITFVPCSEASPPLDTTDFPGEFITSVTHAFRPSFLGPRYSMTLGTSDPASFTIVLSPERSKATLHLTAYVGSVVGSGPNNALHTLPKTLKGLRFVVQSIVRAKTFYTTRPFPVLPGQTMVSPDGKTRLHEAMLQMSPVELDSSLWQARFSDDMSSSKDSLPTGSQCSSIRGCDQVSSGPANTSRLLAAWTSSLSIPIELVGSLLPTFCSAISSRQYSLVVRIKVKGLSIKDFILEVPLQAHRLPCLSSESVAQEGSPAWQESASLESGQQLQNPLSDDTVSASATSDVISCATSICPLRLFAARRHPARLHFVVVSVTKVVTA